MRVLFGLGVVVVLLSCAPAEKEAEAQTIPTGAVQLRFADLNDSLCGADKAGCGGASRPLLAGVRGVAFSADGTKVGLSLDFFHLGLTCGLLGCQQLWERQPKSACYALSGSEASPATDCPPVMELGGAPALALASEDEGFAADHTLRRAHFGMPNGNVLLRGGKHGVALGSHWLGDLEAPLGVPLGWDLVFNGTGNVRPLVGVTNPSGSSVELLLPLPDGRGFSEGLFVDEGGVYWASQADDVFALSLDEPLRLQGRRVRAAITAPQTKTVDLRELPGEVVSAVLTASSTTLSGLAGGDVFELSILRTPKRDEAARPLLAFLPVSAHAPNDRSVVVCFTQLLEPVSGSQFSLAGVEVKSAAVLTGAPQCALLATGPLARNATLSLHVDGVSSRNGDVVRGAVVSVSAPDAVQLPGVQAIAIPKGTRASYPLDGDALLVTSGGVLGRMDLGGVAVESLATVGTPPSSGYLVAKADDGVQGLWVMFSSGGAAPVISLQTASGAVSLGSTDFANGGFLEPVGDGTALLGAAASNSLLRVSATLKESLPRVTVANFRGVLGAGKVLIEDAGRLQVVTLPDTFEAQTFALPSPLSPGWEGPAFTSDGVTWWCAGGSLFRLGDTASLSEGPCTELASDGRGTLWVSTASPLTMRRIRGLQNTEVSLAHPLASARKVTSPQFKAGAVWLDQDTVRLDLAAWDALTGGQP